MKKIAITLTIGVAFIIFGDISSATTINGNLYTEFYSYESRIPDTISHLRSLQGYRLNIHDAFFPGISIFANGRISSDISNKLATDPDYRVFGAYLEYRSNSGRFLARAGRQFLFGGLDGFTLDGGKMQVGIGDKFAVTGFAGTMPGPSFYIYDQVNKWDRRNAFGGRVHYEPSRHSSFNISFLQKDIEENLDARLIGFDTYCKRGYYSNRLRIDYDLLFKRLKLLTIGLLKASDAGHSIRLEYAYRRPSFGQSSMFSIISQKSFNQVRLSSTYKTGKDLYGTGAVSYTGYSNDSNFNLRIGALYKGQSGGVVYATGYGGNKLGLYGALNYQLHKKLGVYASIDMYNFKLDEDQAESETSLAAAFGGRCGIFNGISARAEIQVLTNPVYEYDTRGYLKLDYEYQYKGNTQGYGGGDAK